MAKIKKAFEPIIAILEANPNARVNQVMDQIMPLVEAKAGSAGSARNFHKNEAGEVVAIKCGYFGLWFSLAKVEFGAKASAPSGYNSMCKAGVAAWTQGNASYKKGREDVLEQMIAGELSSEDAQAALAELEEAKKTKAPFVHEEGYTGYETLEECLENL